MRRLRVDIDEIAAAMDNSGYEVHYYLDLETGRVRRSAAKATQLSLCDWL